MGDAVSIMGPFCFCAAPKIIHGDEEELVSMKDLINLTYGLDVSVLSNVGNDIELGKFVIENDLHEDVAAIPEQSLYLIDPAAVGRLQRGLDDGVYVNGKYILAGEYEHPKVYDDQQLPQSDVSTWYAFRLEVTHPPIYEDDELNSKTVWLSLPTTEDEVKAVTDELGMSDIRSCVYYGFESSIPQIESDHFGDMQDFDSLNSLAEMMVEMTPADQVKFKAVLSAEEPSKIEDILDIARNLHQYEHSYMVDDSSDFFREYMLRHMDSRLDSHWFDTLLTRNEDNRLLTRLGATATDYGVVSARGRSLYEIVPYEEQQTEQARPRHPTPHDEITDRKEKQYGNITLVSRRTLDRRVHRHGCPLLCADQPIQPLRARNPTAPKSTLSA